MKLTTLSKIFLSAALTVSVFSACDKKLDLEPRQSIDASTAIQTAADVEAAVVGAYSVMGGGALYGTNLLLYPDIMASTFPDAEEYASWRGTFTGPQQIARKTMNRNNGEAARVWTAAYLAINTANIVLDNLDKVEDADLKAQYEGEALFVRGIMHFELVRYYGLPWGAGNASTNPGVVIKTTVTKTEEQAAEKLPRNTVAEVYAQVIADLTAAAGKLPNDNGTRADRFTALAFLARVFAQQSDYVNARDVANAVIQSNKYAMNASVRAVYDNKNTNESIFEIQQNDQNNAGTANDGMATFYSSLPGIGRGDVRIAPTFVSRNYNASDLRRIEWYYIGTGARPGNTYTSKWKSFSQNLPVIRIAEMYLLRAEMNLRLGTTVGATPADDLAKVRNPVRTNMASIAAPTLDDVLHERLIELAFDGVRIHDIKRLKQAFSIYNWDDDILVWPIPQIEIDATEGILVQNPGY